MIEKRFDPSKTNLGAEPSVRTCNGLKSADFCTWTERGPQPELTLNQEAECSILLFSKTPTERGMSLPGGDIARKFRE